MWLEAVSEPACDAESCPTCGGDVRRRSYGEMYAGAQVLDGKRVEISKRVAEGYANPVWLDPLTQYFDGGLYRLWPSERYLSRGGSKLHRDVWALAFGPVPSGCHIHHKDGDSTNNRLENLECLPASEHLSQTWRETRAGSDEHFTDLAREKAAEWHRSDAGRLWHSRQAKRSKGWTKWKREPKPCEHCGKEMQALVRKSGNSQKYCTSTCKAAAYRARRDA